MAVFKSLIRLLIFWININGTTSDPCLESLEFLNNVGSRNDKCSATDFPLNQRPCDHYLTHAWYKAEDAVIRTKAPVDGNCGADAAAWLKDSLPAVSDGVANRTMCIREGSNNCEEEFYIEIKNCSSFFVYYLPPFPNTFNCPAAYCFDSSLPCTSTSPISTTTTTKTLTESTNTDGNSVTLIVCLTVILPAVVVPGIIVIARLLWKIRIEATNGSTGNTDHKTNTLGDDQANGSTKVILNTGTANNKSSTERIENGTSTSEHEIQKGSEEDTGTGHNSNEFSK